MSKWTPTDLGEAAIIAGFLGSRGKPHFGGTIKALINEVRELRKIVDKAAEIAIADITPSSAFCSDEVHASQCDKLSDLRELLVSNGIITEEEEIVDPG